MPSFNKEYFIEQPEFISGQEQYINEGDIDKQNQELFLIDIEISDALSGVVILLKENNKLDSQEKKDLLVLKNLIVSLIDKMNEIGFKITPNNHLMDRLGPIKTVIAMAHHIANKGEGSKMKTAFPEKIKICQSYLLRCLQDDNFLKSELGTIGDANIPTIH